MLRITRVRIHNIRSVAHLDVTFDPNGVTAIVGNSGAGKSTVLAAMAWALFGDGCGLTQSAARSCWARTPDDECSVTVDADIDGYRITANRSLHLGTTKGVRRETASAALIEAGVRTRNVTPTVLTRRITELTGLTGRMFLGAFYIPQDTLQRLAAGTPAEIAAVFEQQTGLSRLNKPIGAAAEEAKVLTRAAGCLPGSADDAAAARLDADGAKADAAELTETAKNEQERADAITARWRAAQAAADTAAARAEQFRAAQDAVTTTRARLGRATETLDAAADASATFEYPTVRDAQNAAAAAESEMKRIGDTGSSLEAAAASAIDAAAVLAELEAAGIPDITELTAAVEEALAVADRAQQSTTGPAALVAQSQAERSRLSRIIATLSDTTLGDAACPTCQQTLVDGPAGLLNMIREQYDRVNTELATAGTALTTATTAARAANQRATHARQMLQAAQQAATRHESATERVHATKARLVAVIPDGYIDAAAAKTALQAEYRAAAAVRSTAAAAVAAHNATAVAQAAHDREEQAMAAAVAAAGVVAAPDGEAAAKARQLAAQLRADLDAATAQAAKAGALAQSARDNASLLGDIADRAGLEWTRKGEAAAAAERATSTHQLLRVFRAEVLGDYTSSVSASASELLAEVGTEHVGFEVDGDFVPRVVLADGSTMPASELSGGEKARTALCFNLGISAQITGGQRPGMVFADEIGASHDAETRAAVLSMMRGLGLPMVLISHSPDVMDIADKVIRLTKAGRVTEVVG